MLTLIHDDCLNALTLQAPNTVDLTFTSPPYFNARDYSQYDSYDAYLDFLQRVFQQVHRVTNEGRFLVVNTSPVITPRTKRNDQSKRRAIPFDLHHILQCMGWVFIDDIIWVKPDASVKNRIGKFLQVRKPLTYKPNAVTEYVMVYRKRTERLIDWNLKGYNHDITQKSIITERVDRSNVWHIVPRRHKQHSAVFPTELARRIISYYSFVGDTVLDPFAGTGTTGHVAESLNRDAIMIEKNDDYFGYMEQTLRGNGTCTR